jgi:hypothetical protein
MSSYFEKVASLNNWDDSQVINIKENSLNIYKKIKKFTLDQNSVGLLVGKVQSGKTANIIGLSAFAFENEVKMIIVFLSDQNPLYKQNIKRIVKSFDDIDDFVIIDNSKDGNKSNFNVHNLDNFFDKGRKLIVCSLKHHSRINHLVNLLSGTKYSKDLSIIIDDEGDDVSQNTKKGKFKLQPERSSTNDALVKLKNSLCRNNYLSVTATPQASMLLQKYQDLAPSFANLIVPGESYTGLEYFHDPNNNYLIHKIDDYENFIEKNTTPVSFYKSLAYFIIGGYERKFLENNSFKHSMMIHSAKEIINQGNIYKKIKTILDVLRNSFKQGEISDNSIIKNFYNYFLQVFNEEKQRLRLVDKPEEYFKKILSIVPDIETILLNSQQEVDNLNDKIKYFNYFIVIGGDMLDRGLTIDGLAVSYFTRETKKGKSQADTMMQRARWFGYKKQYIKFCKVYTTEKNIQIFENLISHEDSVWDSIKLMDNIDFDLRKVDFAFKIDTEILNPTSKSKVKWTNGFETWNVQSNFSKNIDHHSTNNKLVDNFFYGNSNEVFITKNNIHLKKVVSASEVVDFLNNYIYSERDKYPNNTKGKLEDFLKISNLDNNTKIEVVYMRFKTGEERSLILDEINGTAKLSNLMQGRNEDYKGDRYLLEDKIQLQIHRVILKDNYKNLKKRDLVFALALGIPEKLVIDKVIKTVVVDQI